MFIDTTKIPSRLKSGFYVATRDIKLTNGTGFYTNGTVFTVTKDAMYVDGNLKQISPATLEPDWETYVAQDASCLHAMEQIRDINVKEQTIPELVKARHSSTENWFADMMPILNLVAALGALICLCVGIIPAMVEEELTLAGVLYFCTTIILFTIAFYSTKKENERHGEELMLLERCQARKTEILNNLIRAEAQGDANE